MSHEIISSAIGEDRGGALWCDTRFNGDHELVDLLKALPVAMYATDRNGKITFFNQAAVELWGLRPELGLDQAHLAWRLCRPDGTPLSHNQWPMTVALREARRVGGPAVLAERPDGSRVSLLPHASPLRDAADEIVGAVSMLVDISEHCDVETQRRLLLDEFNHRMKNNLQMLQALLESAGRETRSPEVRTALFDASGRVGAMGAAQHLLYVAGNSTDFSANCFLKSVCANASINFGKKVAISFETGSAKLSNHAAMPLALILNELLTNAAKHGMSESGEVTIKVGLSGDSGSYELYVQDDGPGFDFEQTRKRSSGLGLVTALARSVNGVFTVERRHGARCTVKFSDQPSGARRISQGNL
jgi:PAS domain S-box-containing protein